MAVAVCKPLSILPPTHRSPCAALGTWQRINYQRQERSINASFKAFHHKRFNTGRVYIRALRQGDGGKAEYNKEGGVEDASADAISCEEIPESKSLGSPDQPEPVKEEEQQSSAGKENREPGRGRLHNKLGFLRNATTSRDEDLKMQHHRQQQEPGKQQKKSKQPDAGCRLRSLWRTVRRPQNLLAAFLTGLLLYAIALFGWQVMVVAVDVTLFVLKCSFVAVVLLLVYIFVI